MTEDEETLMDQGHVQVHNLCEENTFGCMNYELKIQGKSSLDNDSWKIVINKSIDLLKKCRFKKDVIPKNRNR